MQKGSTLRIVTLLSLLLFFSSQLAFAHSDWLNPRRQAGIFLELNRPQPKDVYSEIGIWSLFLSGEFELGRRVNLILELPFVRYSADVITYFEDETKVSETLLGNPYVGFRSAGRERGGFWEVGGRLPIVGDDSPNAAYAGVVTHRLRADAFAYKTLSLRGAFGYQYTSPEDLILIVKGGPLFLIPVEDTDYRDAELLGNFSFELWAHADQFSFGGGFSGIAWLSESDIDLSDRLTANALLAAQAQFGNLRPGLHLIVPLNNNSYGLINVIIGANVAFFLPTSGGEW